VIDLELGGGVVSGARVRDPVTGLVEGRHEPPHDQCPCPPPASRQAPFEQGLTVNPAPKTRPPVNRQGLESGASQVQVEFLGGKVEVRENDRSQIRLFQDLGSPAGVRASVEHLAPDKAQRLEYRYGFGKPPPGNVVGVVVDVAPSDAGCVLPRLDQPPGLASRHPEFPLARQEGGPGGGLPEI